MAVFIIKTSKYLLKYSYEFCFLVQKTTLACLLVLAVSMPLSNAYCFDQTLEPGMSDGKIVGKKSTVLYLTDITTNTA